MIFRYLFLSFLYISCFLFSVGQTPKSSIIQGRNNTKAGNTYALIVGISNYEYLPKLSYAHLDAIALRDYLLNVQDIPKKNVFCYTNDSATSLNIIGKLYSISDSIQPNDRFLFYFSGHGDWESKISDNSLLLLNKAPTRNYLRYPDQSINCQTLNEYFKKLSDRNIKTILIADACRSGNLIGGIAGAQTTNLQLKQSWKNEIRILSCMPDEYSYENQKWGGGRGVFSYYLTLGLTGMAKPDSSNLIDISVGNLRQYLEDNIKRETEGKQNPLFEGDSRLIIASVKRKKIVNANTTFIRVPSRTTPIAKGKIDTSSNDFRQLTYTFANQLERGTIAEPVEDCAFTTYRRLLRFAPESYFHNQFIKLLQVVSANYYAYATKFYSEIGYPIEELRQLNGQVQAAMKLTSKMPILFNQYYSERLFIEASLITYSAQHTISKDISRNRMQIAIDSLLKAVSLTQHEPSLYKKLGDCYLLFEPEKAIKVLQYYIELLPNDAMGYNTIGVALYKQSKFKEAIPYFEDAIRLENKNGKFYYNIGMCYQSLGLREEANKYFRQSERSSQPNQLDSF
jgi:protein O-mannosyl-transferase